MKKIYALFLLATTLSACTAESLLEQDNYQENTTTYSVIVSATKSNVMSTKALSLDGKTLGATWAAGEEVRVYSVTGEGYEEMDPSERSRLRAAERQPR